MPSTPLTRHRAGTTPASQAGVTSPRWPAEGQRPENGLGFFLFLLVNLALFIRPADLLPALQGIEIYQYLILSCCAVSFPAVLARINPEKLERSPITICLLLLLPIIVMSHVVHSRPAEAWEEGFAFFKILVYFLLLISLVTTSRRMRIFIGCLIFYTAIMTTISILDFFEVIKLPRPAPPPGVHVYIDTNRLYGPGIFQDPNDVCIVIVACLLLLVARMTDPEAGISRLIWLVPLVIFAVGFYLTRSRGGLLALLAGGAIVIRLRYGWSRAILLAGIALPVLLAVLGARQMEISSKTDTGQARIQLWNEGLVMFRANPLFGVGMNRYSNEAGQVAHNSFMEQFGSTGFFGGCLFLGMIYLAVMGLYRHAMPVNINYKTTPRTITDPIYRHLHPYLAGAMVTTAAGMMTLTINSLVTTYTFLGLCTVFLVQAHTVPEEEPQRFEFTLFLKFAVMGVAFLIGMFIFIRLTFQP